MTEKQLDSFFKKASTVDEKSDVIISYLQSKGLTPDQILDVISLAKSKLEKHGLSFEHAVGDDKETVTLTIISRKAPFL